jgi:hypothetical protein
MLPALDATASRSDSCGVTSRVAVVGRHRLAVLAALELRAHREHAHVLHEQLGHLPLLRAAALAHGHEHVHAAVGLDEPRDARPRR